MPSWFINGRTLKISLLTMLFSGLLVVFLSGPSHTALDPQLDEHHSPVLVFVGESGDSSSPDTPASVSSLLRFPAGEFRAFYSSSLDFIQPPLRLLSYPLLPQAPPHLV
ncbi:hypothetical protein SAMN04488073_2297 [Marinobacter gudaonensis]|uniref:Uncharacterized protein n=1 Tax=Marinobacter gudaonensis TaxID=375760 RepID=A0A1I6H4P2_9GAMM|nr:hypothetical protein [Marinobacter gudaonensis]SFR49466.1 hypothetical protein SAMN04488073_2297 [Marinobacter gudaonensis]